MQVEDFVKIIGSDFYTGVPDSQLKALCDYLVIHYGISKQYMIAANEGNAVALAAGYYLSTGKIPVVFMQNSGIGNAINPIASLLHDDVYGIPCVFVVGWRGEPGTKDEPQHVYQGKVTEQLLKDMDIESYIVGPETTEFEIKTFLDKTSENLVQGKSIAFIVKKNALTYEKKPQYGNAYSLLREEAIEIIQAKAEKDAIVSTTGKISRELFEIRERNGLPHNQDFLTVGSMGHSSSIALGIALSRPSDFVWCIDGDGAVLMHMGAMAVIGSYSPKNLIHILLNNEAHESVGGAPTVANNINFVEIAKGCGYKNAVSVETKKDLEEILDTAVKKKELYFIEVKCSIASRKELGRPTVTPKEAKQEFMRFLTK
jgi:phosphonopyruvate decarboxylase